jgi:hypothetical protein
MSSLFSEKSWLGIIEASTVRVIMTGDSQNSDGNPKFLNIGELAILTDGQRVIIHEVLPAATNLHYVVELPNGSLQQVEAGGLIRAKTYASWVAPGSDWDGRERRNASLTASEDPNRREGDRRRP